MTVCNTNPCPSKLELYYTNIPTSFKTYVLIHTKKQKYIYAHVLHEWMDVLLQDFIIMNVFSVDCKWNDWNPWGNCTEPCGGGQRTRNRNSIDAKYGGETCPGPSEMDENCNQHECPGKIGRA